MCQPLLCLEQRGPIGTPMTPIRLRFQGHVGGMAMEGEGCFWLGERAGKGSGVAAELSPRWSVVQIEQMEL